MARTLKSDKLLFWPTLLLVAASVVMVYSASAVPALDRFSDSSYFLFKQGAWAAIGLALLLVAMRIDYHHYRRPVVIWSLLAITVVALMAVFFFEPRNATYRWLTAFGLSVQPSEVAKLAAIFFAAAVLERRMHRVNDVTYALMPILLVTGVLGALIYREPDFGTAAVLTTVVGGIVFSAGLSYRYLAGAILLALPLAMLLISQADYRLRRLAVWWDPFQDPMGDGYQVIQSMIAVGSGGLVGRGLMGGIQKLYYVPEAHTDFIYAVVGEELGLIGTTVILVCFALIAWRGLRTALRAPDRFGSLLAIGLTLMIVLQAFVNVSVVVGLLPTKGIPLPFVSNGGSSLAVSLVAMGILINISQQSSVPAPAAGGDR